MSAIKKALFDEYGGFADKRIKNIDNNSLFIIDDRTDADIGANKKLYGPFCSIHLNVIDEFSVELTLGGQVPRSPGVSKWTEAYGRMEADRLMFEVRKGETDRLLLLAHEMENIIKPGRRYDTPSYKYHCPRISASLKRVAKLLNNLWQ